MAQPIADKRIRLIEAAVNSFHQNGYSKTSLADISKASKVPLGNVSYYFKTKADLALAVIEEWRNRLSIYLPVEEDPWLALMAFAKQSECLSSMYTATGCPLAGLARDLRQEEEPLRSQAARVHEIHLKWIESQFTSLGFDQHSAKRQTRFFITHLHGAIHLAFTQNDESFIADEVSNLCLWLEELKSEAQKKPNTI